MNGPRRVRLESDAGRGALELVLPVLGLRVLVQHLSVMVSSNRFADKVTSAPSVVGHQFFTWRIGVA